jgi:hypothetical protein
MSFGHACRHTGRTDVMSLRFRTFCALWLLGTPALALVPREPGAGGPERIEPPVAPHAERRLDPAEPGPLGPAARRFLALRGGTWEFTVDDRISRAVMVQGSGVPLVPGAGNALGEDAVAGLRDPDGDLDVGGVEPLARRFLEAHRDLVLPGTGELRFDASTSLARDGGRLISFHYDWFHDGVRVEGARVFVRVNSGNITQFGAPLVGEIEASGRPEVAPGEAVRLALEHGGRAELSRLVGEPELLFQPEEAAGGVAYRLVWSVRFRVRGAIETWEARVDARDGMIVGFRDVNAYGRVTGGVYPRTVIDPEVSAPMPLADVVVDGAAVTADASGGFTYTGGDARCGLDGSFISTNCSDGCSAPPQAEVSFSVGSGVVDFGLGGVDAAGNGASTKAERNAFFHLNQVRRTARQWLPGLSWLDTNVLANVNIMDTCNAFWDGTANLYRSGGGCNNTGEISDVMHHEWGHGLDGNTNGGDGATGEATADIVAMHLSHDARIGPYFQTDGDPVRDLDKNRTAKGLLTRSNVGTKCPAGSGPLGREVHCEGEIYGQTHWDLSQSLVAKHGHHTGWRVLERVFFTSLPDVDSYLQDRPEPAYDAYINADDDDGNLANGTPNGGEIFQAFNTHGIAGTPRSSTAGCLRPAQPALSLVERCDAVDLSWTAIAGVDHYVVLRAALREDTAYVPVATVPASETTYTDTEVAPSVDYRYVVMAVSPGGCESRIESPLAARLADRAILDVSAAVADDVPAGNRSGFADPGEDVDLSVTLRNRGLVGASGITGALTAATPGVTLLDGDATWPDLPVGVAAQSQGGLRFTTDAGQVGCGDRVTFRLAVDDDGACASEDSYFTIRMGDRSLVYLDDFETDAGWSLDAAASTAAAGDWVRGDPDGTSFQTEDDATPDPGHLCWFTAPNAGGLGTDDVDDGVTVLVSPPIDLSGRERAVLSYQRWFANRDLGEDAGDFFKADVSGDGGQSWTNLETLGSDTSAASWTRVEFELTQFIALTSQVRVRFQAADGAATGNLIEAAIDEVRIEEPVCDDTPACFVEPTFAGLGSAGPGASCAEALLTWEPAASNCQNATLTYSVYRGTDPGFVPGPASLVASGISGTSHVDRLLQPAETYYYIVRAVDSRSGEDSNLVRRSVVAPASPDTEPPVFSGLSATQSGAGCGEVDLGWAAAQETCSGPVSYEVYRSTDPAFTPGPANRVGSTLSLGFTDAALVPGASYTYVVRARDEAGNEELNNVRFTVTAAVFDRVLVEQEFEADAGGWSAVTPNTATSGRWEWGNPQGTGVQPEDDFTAAPGVNAWITGLASGGGDGGNDIDGGTTTLLSARYDLAGAVDPAVRYARWFTNDRGASPGEDPLDVEISNNDGGSWTLLEQVGAGTPLAWVEVELPLAGVVTPTANMRFRFTARDLGSGSLVEAGLDGFDLIDRDQGCTGCPLPVGPVGTILARREGDDVVLDWTADPAPGSRFAVYRLSGPTFSDRVRIGTTTGRTFVHEGAALSGQDFYYRVAAIDACGKESAL